MICFTGLGFLHVGAGTVIVGYCFVVGNVYHDVGRGTGAGTGAGTGTG